MTHGRKAAPAERNGHLYYDLLDTTPLGPVLLAATERGLAGIFFGPRGRGALVGAARARLGGRELEHRPEALRDAARALGAYFDGRLRSFELPLDIVTGTPFQRAVWRATARVPYGRLATYGELARSIARPRATRAVGNALGRNPLPIVIPCHRILAAGGGLGGYTGGLRYKRTLLSLEGVTRS